MKKNSSLFSNYETCLFYGYFEEDCKYILNLHFSDLKDKDVTRAAKYLKSYFEDSHNDIQVEDTALDLFLNHILNDFICKIDFIEIIQNLRGN